MLPAPARMRRRSEFTAAVRLGRRVGTPALTLHVGPTSEHGPRIGFVVPRTVGPAVVRNLVRRRLRHLLRDRLALLPADMAVVVRVSPVAAALPSSQLASHLDSALDRALARHPRHEATQ